jgi:hypothetical protein
LRERRDGQRDDRRDHDKSAIGPSGEQSLAGDETGDRGQSEQEDSDVRIRQLRAERPDTLEEVLAAALNAEELGELRHGDGQCRTGLEAEQYRLADEVDERGQPQRPRR